MLLVVATSILVTNQSGANCMDFALIIVCNGAAWKVFGWV